MMSAKTTWGKLCPQRNRLCDLTAYPSFHPVTPVLVDMTHDSWMDGCTVISRLNFTKMFISGNGGCLKNQKISTS